MAYSVRKIDRDTLPRDVDSEDDSEWLDDPVALSIQSPQDDGITLQNIERPAHISPQTHDLVLKTMRGSDAWQETKRADEEIVKLRLKRLEELRRRASAGGADGRAAALVAAELEDLDGERLTRALITQEKDDCLVVHVHAPSAFGSAVLDAAVATLSARHTAIRKHMSDGGNGYRNDTRLPSGKGVLTFARLSAVDAGVTARLDIVDEGVLPAILLYRGGMLSNSRMSVMLPSMRDRHEHDQERRGGEHMAEEKVFEDVDLSALADEVEDLLDELGLYD
jgi:hypothetical protein